MKQRFQLPSYTEMRAKLTALDVEPAIEGLFFPHLLAHAGKTKTVSEFVHMMMCAIGEFMSSTALKYIGYIDDIIYALVEQLTPPTLVREKALTFFNYMYR